MVTRNLDLFKKHSLSKNLALFTAILISSVSPAMGDSPDAGRFAGDALIADYFRAETAKLTEKGLSEIETLEDWTSRREAYRRELMEMLGLDPVPERTPLQAVVTGSVEREGVIAENLHFQSRPGLYVTANLYRPVEQKGPLPAILYVCGHGGVKKDGVSLGNKTHYQHHGAWFARHGYVCLTIDTIQLGEIEGLHHGTYREGMWWWNNRGYTPAGVEAWNCVRSLDYLQSRPEVDGTRLGVTGRSGGGAYSWWVAAIDDRIQVAVPVAGIASLKNHVVDGCVEGHCDCMFMVNTYRWDYPLVAALVAPRPLLISNTDKDRIFPLDGVIDVHAKVRRIYELYGAGDKLGLHITEGPHKDTQELRVHAFRWFNRFLRGTDELVRTPATHVFQQEELKVFDELPGDQRVTFVHEWFVPAVSAGDLPSNREELQKRAPSWISSLSEKTFRGWPERSSAPSHEKCGDLHRNGLRLRTFTYESQSPFRLPVYVLSHDDSPADTLIIRPLDQSDWESIESALAVPFPEAFQEATADRDCWDQIQKEFSNATVAFVLPRGIGPTRWSDDEKTRTHIRRRFMQVGQTLAGMQTYDVVRAIKLLEWSDELRADDLELAARGDAATWALYASLFCDKLDRLVLRELPAKNRDAPDLLNASRYLEMPQAAMLAASRVDSLRLQISEPETMRAWQAILSDSPFAEELIQLERASRDAETEP